MTKTKTKTNSHKLKPPRTAAVSSSKSSGIEKKERGKEAKKEANTEKPVEELWSAWIWEKDLDLFYRARFREDKRWEYEYAAGPPPLALAITNDPEPSRYVSSTTSPITCTKDDLDLKEICIEPHYAEAIPDAFITSDGLTSLTSLKVPDKKDGVENTEGKTVNVKTDEKVEIEESRPTTPRKTARSRLKRLEKVEAYIEGLKAEDKAKSKAKHIERRHKHLVRTREKLSEEDFESEEDGSYEQL